MKSQSSDIEQCPICSSDDVERTEVTETFTYEGMTTNVPNYVVDKCNNCGEYFPTNESVARAEFAIRILHKLHQVTTAPITSK